MDRTNKLLQPSGSYDEMEVAARIPCVVRIRSAASRAASFAAQLPAHTGRVAGPVDHCGERGREPISHPTLRALFKIESVNVYYPSPSAPATVWGDGVHSSFVTRPTQKFRSSLGSNNMVGQPVYLNWEQSQQQSLGTRDQFLWADPWSRRCSQTTDGSGRSTDRVCRVELYLAFYKYAPSPPN